MIFGAVVLNHSKDFEVFLYSSLAVDPKADVRTKKFQDLGNWRDISTLDDEKSEALIRADKIDILVDLSGHTNGGRLALFTRKPAPVQVTAWGFAHGTGCPEIDYFFADPVAVPEEERQHYAEKIFDLQCVVTYDKPEYDLKGTSALPYHSNGCITFGSYARYEKLSDACLETFAEILRRVPSSRLQFKDGGFRRPYSIKRVLAAMPDISPERLLFSVATSHPEHMQAYQQADIMLDPFPHTGGVVGMEQIYMGVPVVTLYGTQASGRTTSAVLTAMGRKEWIAKSREQYIDIAANLAADIPALTKARKTLREELLASPVVKDYPKAVEAAYRQMWLTR
jgi:predicted O-linked N-acetylglucosamine transferase (SPINDLY family)